MARLTPTRFVSFGTTPTQDRYDELTARTLPIRGLWKGSEVNPLSERLVGEIARSDVVHVHQWESVVANACVLQARAMGKRVYATNHGGSGKNYWRRFRLNRLLTGFIAQSRFAAARYPEMADRMSVVVGGVDTDRFSPAARVPRGDHALFVGRLLPHKGIDKLIDALPATTPLEVIGRTYDTSFRRYLAGRASGKDVTFREDVDDDDLVSAYRRARVVALPSLYEPTFGPPAPQAELLGLTLLEAMACGTPAVCTAVGGMPEIVNDPATGRIVPPGDPDALAAAVESLRRPGQAWEDAAHAARTRAESMSWEVVAAACLDIYRSGPTSPHALRRGDR